MRRPALLALIVFCAAPAFAGLVFKQTTKGGDDASRGVNQTTRVAIDVGGAKIEFLDAANPLMPAGSYMLMRPDDDAMILVNPKDKTYATIDFAAMMQSMAGMMGQQDQAMGEQGVTREASKPVVEKLLEEDGGTILGRPTKHFRFRMRWTMTMNMGPGMAMILENDSTEDSWVAELAIDPKIARAFANMGGGAALPKDMQAIAEAQKEMMKGLPLKRIVTTKTNMTGTGMMAAAAKMANREGSKPSTMTTEVVELSEEKVPASTFAIPAGYSETEMMSPGMKMPDMNRPPN